MNRNTLADRVVKAADAALDAQGYVSPVDVLVGIGWLDVRTVERWRRGQIDCLERAVQTDPSRISEAMKLFRSWASERNLSESPTNYVARGPQSQTLRFSRSGETANTGPKSLACATNRIAASVKDEAIAFAFQAGGCYLAAPQSSPCVRRRTLSRCPQNASTLLRCSLRSKSMFSLSQRSGCASSSSNCAVVSAASKISRINGACLLDP